MRDHGRNAIWVASDLLRGEKSEHRVTDVADGHRREPAGHARARGGEVRPPGDAVSRRASASRATAREMDGKSIMGILLLAAARGIDHHDHAPTAPTSGTRSTRWSALVESGFGEDACSA